MGQNRVLVDLLLQDDELLAFASRSTETETRYANIKKEILAILYGLE